MLRSIVVIAAVFLGAFALGRAGGELLNLPIKQVVDGKCVRVLVIEHGQKVTKPCSWLREDQIYQVEPVGR